VRRDPMAMKPFAGYNFGDYWSHWISVGAKLKSPPQIFHVNWFRQNEAGKFLWPGYGENLRVLRWIIDRCKGTAQARDTAIGRLPNPADLDTQRLDLAPGALDELLAVNPSLWQAELAAIGGYLAEYADRVPQALKSELADALDRVSAH
jgi:phosphoenolpyruvate carboxykinase (GTP)